MAEEATRSKNTRAFDTETDTGAADGLPDGSVSVRHFLTYRFHRLSVLLSRQMHDELQRRYGMALAEWRVVSVLSEYGTLSLRDTARRSSMDKAQVSRLLPGLVKRGYVVRTDHPTDKRRASLELTPAGQQLYDELIVLGQQRQEWLSQPLNPAERAMMTACLDRLLAHVEAQPEWPIQPAEATDAGRDR